MPQWVTHTLTHLHTLSLSLSLAHTHTHTHLHTLTHTHTHTHTLTHWSPVVCSVLAPGQSFHATFPPILQTSTTNPSFWTHKCTLCKHTHTLTHTLHTHILYALTHTLTDYTLHPKLQTFSFFSTALSLNCDVSVWVLPCGQSLGRCCCPLGWAGNSCSTW